MPPGRFENPRQQFENSGLSCAVRTNDAQRLTRMHGKGHIFQRPKLLSYKPTGRNTMKEAFSHGRNEVSKTIVALAAMKLLPHTIEDDRRSGHTQMYSANLNSAR